MKAKVKMEEILEAFKKTYGQNSFSKDDAIKTIREVYEIKTGEPCSKNTAMDKFKYLVDVEKIVPDPKLPHLFRLKE